MSRENVEVKARRYLTEGRVNVVDVTGQTVTAAVRGAGAVYRTTHHHRRGWHCTCPARSRCAHVAALELITVVSDDHEANR